MFDKELHNEYILCSYLGKLLPADPAPEFDLDNRVKLEYYRLGKTYEGAIELDEKTGKWKPTVPKKAGSKKEKLTPLEEIIEKINEEFSHPFLKILHRLHILKTWQHTSSYLWTQTNIESSRKYLLNAFIKKLHNQSK